MKLILNGNLEFEVARKPKLSGDPIQIPLVDASSIPEVIEGEVILQDMIVWPTQEVVTPPAPVEPEVAEGEEELIQEEIPGYAPDEAEPEVEELAMPEVMEPVVVEPQPEVFVLYKTTAEDWLRHYVSGNTLCFTNTPVPEPVAPYVPTEEEIRLETESNVRKERDRLIADTDWTQVLDAPITAQCRDEFRVYRQALRDVPQQEEFPYNIQWPDMPEVVKATPDPVDTALEILVGGEV